jgi:hypothetical protein
VPARVGAAGGAICAVPRAAPARVRRVVGHGHDSVSSYGEDSFEMSVQADQLLFRYLSRVGDLAQGVLSPARRVQLVAGLRARIEQDRLRLGIADADSMRRLLDSYGKPEVLVAAETQRDPDYQAQLAARLTPRQRSENAAVNGTSLEAQPAPLGPQSPLDDDLGPSVSAVSDTSVTDLISPAGSLDPSLAGGPEVPLDPDPFGDLGAEYTSYVPPEDDEEPAEDAGGADAQDTATLPPVLDGPPAGLPDLAPAPTSWQQPQSWQDVAKRVARTHVRETVAMLLFLIALLIGSWIPLVLGYLVVMTSYSYSAREKRTGVIGVLIAALVAIAIGFWLDHSQDWGGTKLNRAAVLGSAGTFFGTVPRVVAAIAMLYFGWRLGRKLSRES